MTQCLDIALEPLTAAAFAPFGLLLAAQDRPADFSRPGLSNWRLPFHSDAQLRLQVMRYGRQEMRFSRLERHLAVTEGRVPIGQAQAVLIVAEGDDIPQAHTLRAFYLDGSVGILFHKAVWHGLDCFPAHDAHADFLMLSDSATEDEIETIGDPISGVRTHVYDFAATQRIAFQVTDPMQLLQPGANH